MKQQPAGRSISDTASYSARTNIADALASGPDVAAVFLRYRMYCIGCTFARFETLRVAAINHSIDVEEFVTALNAVRIEAAHESQARGSVDNSSSEEV
jgi:hybrid cluster-associated redox disulfide protein